MGKFVAYVLMGEEDFVATNKLEEDQVAFIIDMEKKIIYAWHGRSSSKLQQYKCGTNATKLKSKMHYYGFGTEIIKQGGEPAEVAIEIEALLAGKGEIPSKVKETITEEAIKKGEIASPAIARAQEPEEHAVRPSSRAEPPQPSALKPSLAEIARVEAERRAVLTSELKRAEDFARVKEDK
nr:hypothetical protein [Candidatus Sigynarchaeota archaeon]